MQKDVCFKNFISNFLNYNIMLAQLSTLCFALIGFAVAHLALAWVISASCLVYWYACDPTVKSNCQRWASSVAGLHLWLPNLLSFCCAVLQYAIQWLQLLTDPLQ